MDSERISATDRLKAKGLAGEGEAFDRDAASGLRSPLAVAKGFEALDLNAGGGPRRQAEYGFAGPQCQRRVYKP